VKMICTWKTLEEPLATERTFLWPQARREGVHLMVLPTKLCEIVPGVMQMNCLLTEVSLVACWINIAQSF